VNQMTDTRFDSDSVGFFTPRTWFTSDYIPMSGVDVIVQTKRGQYMIAMLTRDGWIVRGVHSSDNYSLDDSIIHKWAYIPEEN
jgi:hypothetical protein